METFLNYRGDLLAVCTALIWGLAIVYFRHSGKILSSIPLKVFQNIVSTILFFVCIPLFGEPLWLNLSNYEWLILLGSALIGITVGDTLYVAAIRRIGASPQAILDCIYAPTVIFLAFIFFGEQLPPLALVGAAVVITAILIGNADLSTLDLPKRDVWIGVIYGLLSQVAMAICVLMIRDILFKESVLTVTAYRFAFGTLILIIGQAFGANRAQLFEGFRWNSNLKVLLTGAFLGPFLSTLFWFAGFKYTLAGKAAVYNQLSTVFIILFAAWLLKEPISKRRWIAVSMAICGGVLVAWS